MGYASLSDGIAEFRTAADGNKGKKADGLLSVYLIPLDGVNGAVAISFIAACARAIRVAGGIGATRT